MQTNIIWTGHAYNSVENCLITKTGKGLEINSTIKGAYNDKIYKVEYLIRTTMDWETVFLELKTQLSGKTQTTIYEGNGKGHWIKNGLAMNEFTGCIDVDISLTPFTNSLPINRLQWGPKQARQLKMLFVDVLEEATIPVQQQYTKISDTEFKFETVPNDFEAVITVDDLGLVVDYPTLFTRTARHRRNYE